MARPRKEGLKYFPHDTDMSQDDKIQKLEDKFGMIGYGIYNKLLEKIYLSGGKFKINSEEDLEYYSKKFYCENAEQLKKIINLMISVKLLDKNFMSNGIKKRIDTIKTERERKRKSYEKNKTDKSGVLDGRNYGETTEKLWNNTGDVCAEKEKEKEKEKESVCNKHTEQTHEFLTHFKATEDYKKNFKQYDLDYYDERVSNYYAGQISGYEFWKKKIKLFIQNDERDGKAVKIKIKKIKPHEYAYMVVMRFREELLKKKSESNGNFNEVIEAKEIQQKISSEPEYQKMIKIHGGQINFSIISEIERLQ